MYKNDKKRMLIIGICVVATIIIFSISLVVTYNISYNKGFADNQPIAKDNTPVVYVTPSGERYHRKNCDYVNSSNIIEISTKQAKSKGYTACSQCSPGK